MHALSETLQMLYDNWILLASAAVLIICSFAAGYIHGYSAAPSQSPKVRCDWRSSAAKEITVLQARMQKAQCPEGSRRTN